MRRLKLVGLSDDGTSVVFADEAGSEYAAPVDARLKAALRGDRARIGQLEIDMGSALRPRDIQARIRGGQSPEEVAAAAQVSLDRVMGYAVPVLAERQHIAESAQRSPIRRGAEGGTVRRLDDLVRDRLGGRAVAMDSVNWDSWRRDDGRWTLELTYRSGDRPQSARFIYDALGRYSVADDDEAKWITGEKQHARTRSRVRPADDRRSDDRHTDDIDEDDLLGLAESPDYEFTDDLTAVVRAVADEEEHSSEAAFVGETGFDEESTTVPIAEPVAERPTLSSVRPPPGESDAGGETAAAEQMSGDDDEQPSGSARRRSKRRRPSMPTWDEIMLGRNEESR
jgi:Protein of unknown function (DUF3071)